MGWQFVPRFYYNLIFFKKTDISYILYCYLFIYLSIHVELCLVFKICWLFALLFFFVCLFVCLHVDHDVTIASLYLCLLLYICAPVYVLKC